MLVSLSNSQLIWSLAGQYIPLWLAFSMRAWVKLVIVKRIAIDDWILLFSTVLLSVELGLGIFMIQSGVTTNGPETPPDVIGKVWRLWTSVQVIYYVNSALIKLSVAILLLRLTIRMIHRRIIVVVVTFNAITSVVFLFSTLFHCWPVESVWNKSIPGSCMSNLAFHIIVYVGCTFLAAANLAFTTLPLWMIWDWKMGLSARFSIYFVLLLGALASFLGLYRINYMRMFTSNSHINELEVAFVLWSTLEMTLGILGISLITIQPLLTVLFKSLRKVSSAELDENWGWNLDSGASKRHLSTAQTSAADVENVTEKAKRIGEDDVKEWNRILETIRTTNTKRDPGTKRDDQLLYPTVSKVGSVYQEDDVGIALSEPSGGMNHFDSDLDISILSAFEEHGK